MKPEGSQPFCAGAVKPKKVLKIQSYAHKNYSISIQYLLVNEVLQYDTRKKINSDCVKPHA